MTILGLGIEQLLFRSPLAVANQGLRQLSPLVLLMGEY